MSTALTKETHAKYRDIAARLRRQIADNQFKPGERLPSLQELCDIYEITPSTVVRVYGLLEQEGLIERQRGRGVFVTGHKRPQTGNIGVIGNLSLKEASHPFYAALHHGMYCAVERFQRHLIIVPEQGWNDRFFEMIDGLISVGHTIEMGNAILSKMPAHIPVVSMFTPRPDMPSVTADEYGGAKQAVSYLRKMGHTRIACLMDRHKRLPNRRHAGYTDGLLEAGIEADERWSRFVSQDTNRENYHQWGRNQMFQWLREDWHRLQCTALLVQNDSAAIGAMHALQEEGIKVPDQVSIIGFDGTELCDHVIPRLTSMEMPLGQIGEKTVEVMVERIESGSEDVKTIMLPLTLREGESVSSPPRFE